MKKYSVLFLSGLVLALFCCALSSCKSDEPFVKPKLSFSESTKTVNEADGTITIDVTLDKAATEDFTITYKLAGTAIDKVTAGSTSAYDYEITSDYLEAKVKAGDTKGTIEIKLYSDLGIEDDETIIISIKDVDTDNVEITRDDDIEITIVQEDGILILLEWDYPVTPDSVDLDLFLWAEDATSTLGLTDLNSANANYISPEGFFLPTAILDDGTYGLSCNYYEGKADPMTFTVTFIEIVNNVDVSTTVKTGIYTLANINAWDVTKVNPLLVQTFEKLGTDYKDFSEITVPSSGSRIGSPNTFIKPDSRNHTPDFILPTKYLRK